MTEHNSKFFQSLTPSSEGEEAAFEKARELSQGLFAHQVEGVAFLLARRRAILADDMGLGKTRQSIVSVRQAAPEGPYLVVCPAAVKLNWEREIRVCTPAAPTLVVNGSGPLTERLGSWNGWVIINYDLLGKHIAALRGAEWQAIVFDERTISRTTPASAASWRVNWPSTSRATQLSTALRERP